MDRKPTLADTQAAAPIGAPWPTCKGTVRDRAHMAGEEREDKRGHRPWLWPPLRLPTIGTSSGFFSPTNLFCTHVASAVSTRLMTM